MKKFLVSVVLFSSCAYGMENKNSASSEKSNSSFITLKGNDDLNDDLKETLDKDFLPEAWYRQLDDYKQAYDPAGNPLIILKNVSSELLPLVKNALYLMRYILLIGSEHKGTQVAYKNFQALNLSLDQAAELLVALDYLRVPKALLAGLARLFVQLTQGEEPDLGSLNNEIKKEINRYFYLLYNKEIEGEPEGDRHLHDLLEFDRLNKSTLSSEDSTSLDLCKQKLASVCSMSKLMKLGIIPTLLKTLNLSKNRLKEVPVELVRNCFQLQYLYLYKNQLEKVPVDLLKDCPKLRQLDLCDNQLREVPKDLVKHCSQLEKLYLSRNQLEKVLISNCPQLQQLRLSGNQLKEVSISNCPQLQYLTLFNNQLTVLPIESLEQLNNIKELHIMNNSAKINFEELSSSLQKVIRRSEKIFKQAEEDKRKRKEQKAEMKKKGQKAEETL